MGSTRSWLLLLLGQAALAAAIAVGLTALQARAPAGAPADAGVIALRVAAVAAMVGIVACIPPLALRAFDAAQTRIGNDAHPMVAALRRHERGAARTVWAMWAAGALLGVPFLVREARREQREQRAASESSAGDPTRDDAPTATPDPATRAAMLDAVRATLRSDAEFQIDHARATDRWAFVRATELVTLDGGASQETDLTVAALLTRDAATARWRVVEHWTLPTEDRLPLAEFRRRLGAHQASARLPASLFPDDLAPTAP